MVSELSRRRFLTGCGAAGLGALAAGQVAGSAAQAGPPETRWNRVYEGGSNDRVSAVEPAGDGHVVAGWTDRDGETSRQAWLYRVDAAGELVWQETYSERSRTEAADVVATDDGFVLVGHTRGGEAERTGIVIETGPSGEERRRWLGGDIADESLGQNRFRGVDRAPDGGLVVVGERGQSSDGWVVRLTSPGQVDWQTREAPNEDNRFHGVLAAEDGSYVAVGTTGNDTTSLRGWATRFSAAGEKMWAKMPRKRTDGDLDALNVFYAVSESDSGFVAAGTNAPEIDGDVSRGWAFEYNAGGSKRWDARVQGDQRTELRDIVAGNLEYFAVGRAAPDGYGEGSRGYAVNLDISGAELWADTYLDPQYNADLGDRGLDALSLQADDGLVCVGSAAPVVDGDRSAWGLQVGGDPISTATATPAQTTAAPTDSTATSTDSTATSADSTTGPTDSTATPVDAAVGGDTATASPAPTETATATTAAGDQQTTAGGGGNGLPLSPAVIGGGVVVAALAAGGVLYSRFAGGSDDSGQSDNGPGGDDGGGPGVQRAESIDDHEVAGAETVVESSGSVGDAGFDDDLGSGAGGSGGEAGDPLAGSDPSTGDSGGDDGDPLTGDDGTDDPLIGDDGTDDETDESVSGVGGIDGVDPLDSSDTNEDDDPLAGDSLADDGDDPLAGDSLADDDSTRDGDDGDQDTSIADEIGLTDGFEGEDADGDDEVLFGEGGDGDDEALFGDDEDGDGDDEALFGDDEDGDGDDESLFGDDEDA